MALKNLTGVGQGGAGLNKTLPDAVRELQNTGTVAVAGAAANTLITPAGLTAKHTVRSVIAYTAGAVPVICTPAAGNTDGFKASATQIKVNENTTGATLHVHYAVAP